MSVLSGEKFELKILKTSGILLHEECEDNRWGKLAERFENERVLYNPLIVGRQNEKHILIDGANRYEALKRMGCGLILAQIVNYRSPKVLLKSWHHFVSGITIDEIIAYAESENLYYEKCSFKKLEERVSSFINVVGVVSKQREVINIKLSRDFSEMLAQLCRLNSFYEKKFSYSRIDSDTSLDDISSLSPSTGLLFVYPSFGKKHIVKITGLSQKLPAGISRHLIPNRVLHIKYNIEFLRMEKDIDRLNKDLQEVIDFKVASKKVRLYREPILVFDE